MIRSAIFFICLTGIAGILSAQKYNTLAGVRMADDFSIVFVQRLFDKHTLEARLGTGISVPEQRYVLLMNRHYPLISKRFNLFLGAGGFYSRLGTNNENNRYQTGLALDAGAELTIGRLSLAIDYQPNIALSGKTTAPLLQTNSGLSLRYVLVKRKSSVSKKLKIKERIGL
jgi:hypothetical protein